MKIARIVLLIVIMLAGVVTVLVTTIARPATTAQTSPTLAVLEAENFSTMIEAALADYETNASNADNVYQQQVVAGWGAKDLLSVIGKQNSSIIDTQVAAANAQNSTQTMVISNQIAALSAQGQTQSLIRGVMVIGVLILAALVLLGFMLLDLKRTSTIESKSSESGLGPVEMAV